MMIRWPNTAKKIAKSAQRGLNLPRVAKKKPNCSMLPKDGNSCQKKLQKGAKGYKKQPNDAKIGQKL